jgi:hypothetical protein
MKGMKIVIGSIGTQHTIMACKNYQVTYFVNKSIAWCGDRK